MFALLRHNPWTAMSLPRRKGMLSRIDAGYRLWREREDLANLEPRMLRDLGITEADVVREKARAVWDAPGWWV